MLNLKSSVSRLLGVLLAVVLLPTQATEIRKGPTLETVQVLGQQLVFTNPAGYCTPGQSPRELEYVRRAQAALVKSVRLVHAAVRCDELDEFKAMRRDFFGHWLQVQLLGTKEGFKRLEIPREVFITEMGKSSSRLNMDVLLKRANERLNAMGDLSLSGVQIDSIGRDGNAAYFAVRTNVSVGQLTIPVTGIGGLTLINSLPLSINVFEGTGTPQSKGKLVSVQQELLRSLLTEN